MKNTSFAHAALSLASLAGCFSLVACTDVKSSDLKTDGMSAQMTVTADGTGATNAVVELNVDDSLTDFVTLSSGDSLVATVAGQSQTMSESDLLNDISYLTTFTGQDAPNASYTIAFKRTTDASAPASTCTLPSPFTLSAPAAGASFSRANDAINITYASAGTADAMEYSVSGVCVDGPIQALSGDPGTFSIPKGMLALPSSSSDANQTCQVTLTVTRKRVGQLDPAFGSGGEIDCVQSRTYQFTSTP